MVNDPPQRKYQRNRRSVERADYVSEAERQYLYAYLDAYDPDVYTSTPPEGEDTLSYGTLKQKTSIWKRYCKAVDDAHEADAHTVNEYLTRMERGDVPDAPSGGYAPNTIKQSAMGLRVIYAHHDQIAKHEIALPEGEDTHVDEDDMFSSEEIQALRDACPNARDRAILELLIYTGQRVRAIQTIRITDLDLDRGLFRLNPTVDGMKNAEGKRPLLGAVGPVRRWLQQHPAPDEDDAFLITCLPNSTTGTPGDPITVENIQYRMRKLGNDAGVEKPTNPHNFRHYFVTVCKRDYGLSDSEIKHLLGHRPDSNVMDTTYSHLTDEEVAENVSVKAGFKEETDEDSPLSPPSCTVCDEPLPEDARACPVCGTTFTPDAKQAQDRIEDLLYESRAQAEDETVESEIDDMRERLREDPEARAEILEWMLEKER